MKTYVIGSGGHAKVVIRMLQDLGHTVMMVFDDNPVRWKAAVCGVPVSGPLERILNYGALPTVIAIGNNSARRLIANRYGLDWMTVVGRHAIVDASVELGPGTVVLAGAVIQAEARLGRHVIVNTGATIDHDCVIEDFVHLAPGTHLAGNVLVGSGAFLGIGATAIPGTIIGEETTVGAGAAIVRSLPDRVLAVGVPARVVRRLERVESDGQTGFQIGVDLVGIEQERRTC